MDWKRIKAEYIAGGTSYRKLSEKYGVSFNTLKTHAVEEQWYKLRQQKDKKTTTKIIEDLSDKDAQKAVDIVDVADKLLSKITEVLEVVTTTQDIRHLTSALKDIKDIKGVKSEADIREQEARIAKLQREAQEDEARDTTVIVQFEEDITKWSK